MLDEPVETQAPEVVAHSALAVFVPEVHGRQGAAFAAGRERMLSVAWERFCERPYEQVRLADIAGDAGVTIQTLHSRFGAKEDLFVAAWRWFARPQGVRRDRVAVGDLRAGIRALSSGARVRDYATSPRSRSRVRGAAPCSI